MMPELTIRFVLEDDVERVVELCREHAKFEKAEYQIAGKAEKLKESLFSNNPKLHCLVAEVSAEIVGFATYMKQFSTWEAEYYLYLDCLFLMRSHRGLGIGEKLIDKVKREAGKLSCGIIQWQTPTFNERAMKFILVSERIRNPKNGLLYVSKSIRKHGVRPKQLSVSDIHFPNPPK